MTLYGLIELDNDGFEIDVCETAEVEFDRDSYQSELVQAGDALTAGDDELYEAYQQSDAQDTFECWGRQYRVRILTESDEALINNSETMSDAKWEIIRRECSCGSNSATFAELWEHLPEESYSLPATTIAKILNAMQERYQAGRASVGGVEICDDCLWVPEKYTRPEYGGLLVPLEVLKTLKIERGVKNHEFEGGYTEVTYKNGQEVRNRVTEHCSGVYNYTQYTVDYTEWGAPVEEQEEGGK